MLTIVIIPTDKNNHKMNILLSLVIRNNIHTLIIESTLIEK